MRVLDPDGVENPITPGRRPGEMVRNDGRTPQGCHNPSGFCDPFGVGLNRGAHLPGVFDPGLMHLRRLRRRLPLMDVSPNDAAGASRNS